MSVTPGIEFDPKRDWIDVSDPANPPAGASKITRSDLLRYEDGLADTEVALDNLLQIIPDEISTQVSTVTEEIAESAVWPDTANPGLYFFRQGGQLVPSDVPGLYVIDQNLQPMPNFEIPSRVMVQVWEAGGTYVRPTDDVNVCCVFIGVTDPGAIALERDEWKKLT